MTAPSEHNSDHELADQIDLALHSFWSGNSAALDNLLAQQDRNADPDAPAGDDGVAQALRSAAAQMARSIPIEPVPSIPGYEILRELGRGGMGVVYEAFQIHPRRPVALKLMQAGREGDRYHRLLFAREVQALANLDHPNIALLHHAGTTDDGRSFFVMELVRGQTIVDHATACSLDRTARLTLFCQLCDAVHHAHMRGVIHRDLKPSNILVTEPESGSGGSGSAASAGRVKVLDFGLARLSNGGGTEGSLAVDAARIKGTLAYMSPEQLGGDQERVDARTDVYSLGVVMYQLLAGKLPYELTGQSLADMVRLLESRDPMRLGALNRSLQGDLEVIALTAIERDLSRRYQSAAQLGDDVRRFMQNEPIFARPATALYQLRKFAQRNRALVAGSAAVLIALLLGAIGTSIGLFRAERNAADANDARNTAEIKAYAACLAAAEAALVGGDVRGARENLDQAPEHLRGWEWRHFQSQLDRSLMTFTGHTAPVWVVAASRNGEFLASSSRDKTVRLWDATTGRERAVLQHEGPVTELAISPDDKLLASATTDHTIRLWSIADSQARDLGSEQSRITDLAFGPSQTWLASCTAEGVRMWDLETRTSRALLVPAAESTPLCFAISPDGETLVMGMKGGDLISWHLPSGTHQSSVATSLGEIVGVSYSSDGRRIAVSSAHGEIAVVNAESLATELRLFGHAERTERVVFSPDDSIIASPSWDATLRLWDARTGRPLRVLVGHQLPVSCAAFSPDGKRLYSASSDGTLRAWSSIPGDEAILIHPTNRVQQFIADRHDRWIAAAYSSIPQRDGVLLWSVSRQRPFAMLYEHQVRAPCEVIKLVMSPDGTRLAGCFCDGGVRIWDTEQFDSLLDELSSKGADVESSNDLVKVQPILSLPTFSQSRMTAMTFSRDGGRIIAGGDGVLQVWDALTGEAISEWTLPSKPVSSLAFDPVADHVLRGAAGGTIDILNANDGTMEGTLAGQTGSIVALAFSPDGRLLASACTDGTVGLWNWQSRRLLTVLKGHAAAVNSVAFSPDGLRLASASNDHSIKLWDPKVQQLMATLHGHSYLVNCVAFTGDGHSLISGSADRTLRLWEAPDITHE